MNIDVLHINVQLLFRVPVHVHVHVRARGPEYMYMYIPLPTPSPSPRPPNGEPERDSRSGPRQPTALVCEKDSVALSSRCDANIELGVGRMG